MNAIRLIFKRSCVKSGWFISLRGLRNLQSAKILKVDRVTGSEGALLSNLRQSNAPTLIQSAHSSRSFIQNNQYPASDCYESSSLNENEKYMAEFSSAKFWEMTTSVFYHIPHVYELTVSFKYKPLEGARLFFRKWHGRFIFWENFTNLGMLIKAKTNLYLPEMPPGSISLLRQSCPPRVLAKQKG